MLVEFDKYSGKCLQDKLFPIVPITKTLTTGKQVFSRKQFPLSLAYAITIHKSQGLTLPKVILEFTQDEIISGLTYVAFSRVRKLSDLLISGRLTMDRFISIARKKQHDLRKAFFEKYFGPAH